MKKLPIGLQNFKKIITENYLYVDKTEFIYKLINVGCLYFISRPRRFGKTLFLSTLEEFFLGNKELFKDLWIYNSDYDWQEYPVVKIDFGKIKNKNSDETEKKENFKNDLKEKLKINAEKYNIEIDLNKTIKSITEDLILRLNKKYNKSVVILVDEYDKPILDNIGFDEIKEYNKDVLKDLFETLKSLESNGLIKFLFVTGVTKFGGTALFSGFNNLKDLTLNKEYQNLFGITKNELINNFSDYLEIGRKELYPNNSKEEFLKEIERYYNGYRFVSSMNTETVFNPFSILNFFMDFRFSNYWFATGTPTFLFETIKINNYKLENLENVEISESSASAVNITDLKLKVLLYQAGYLTIVGVDKDTLILNFPNYEVKKSYLEFIYNKLSYNNDQLVRSVANNLIEYLRDENYEEFFEYIKNTIYGIPNTLLTKNNLSEAYFHTLMYYTLALIGLEVESEVQTLLGRSDLVLKFDNKIYIFELKFDKTAKEAIDQIYTKKYFKKYLNLNKKIILIGINFSYDEKNINEFIIEDFKG